jgi:hypothetical protein
MTSQIYSIANQVTTCLSPQSPNSSMAIKNFVQLKEHPKMIRTNVIEQTQALDNVLKQTRELDRLSIP